MKINDKLVQQRFRSDCVVACLAMFLSVDYEDIVRHCSGYELTLGGIGDYRQQYICRQFKVETVSLDRTKLDRSKPAMLTVPSLNSEAAQTHAIYWDGTRIYDPNQGRPGKKTYTNQMAWEVVIDGIQRADALRAYEEDQ